MDWRADINKVVRDIMKTLSVGVTSVQHDYLIHIKQYHGISMSAQVRELIRMRMDGGMILKGRGIRREVPPMDGKHPPVAHISSINEEMKKVVDTRRKRYENTGKTDRGIQEESSRTL